MISRDSGETINEIKEIESVRSAQSCQDKESGRVGAWARTVKADPTDKQGLANHWMRLRL